VDPSSEFPELGDRALQLVGRLGQELFRFGGVPLELALGEPEGECD
jgi:hypothetical protein